MGLRARIRDQLNWSSGNPQGTWKKDAEADVQASSPRGIQRFPDFLGIERHVNVVNAVFP
jgi:hypothetical protein